MKAILYFVAIGALALAAGCATMAVSSHVQRGLDSSSYHTYELGPADSLPVGDPRFEDDAFFKDHILGAVEKQMAAKGFGHAPSTDRADLLVHYHAVISTRLDVNRIDREDGELENACERIAQICTCGTVRVGCLSASILFRAGAQPLDSAAPTLPASEPTTPVSLDDRLREVEANLIRWALKASGGNKSRAAELLQIKRSTLGDRINRCGLGPNEKSEKLAADC